MYGVLEYQRFVNDINPEHKFRTGYNGILQKVSDFGVTNTDIWYFFANQSARIFPSTIQ